VPFITVGKENSGNIDLYYEDHGHGPPVVLIHGFPLSGASWEKQAPVLVAGGHRVITYDRRGFGQSSKPFFGYEYDTLTEDLHKLITSLDLRDVTLVGFSMGGGEVARYLGKYGSDRVRKAVFISAITPFLLKTPDNPEGLEAGLFAGIETAIIEARPSFLSQFFTDFFNVHTLGDRVSDDALRYNWNIAVAASPRATHECVSAWLTDFREELKRIEVPTLVIHGDADRICPLPSSGKRMSKFVKDCRLRVINGGPHAIYWTHAAEVNRELLSFIGQEDAVELGRQTAA
jgi:non-heme chloroperoxidase